MHDEIVDFPKFGHKNVVNYKKHHPGIMETVQMTFLGKLQMHLGEF